MSKENIEQPATTIEAQAQPDSLQQPGSTTLAECYLEHAARETQWAAESAKGCAYQAAANALERRNVWLTAALIAQERKA